MSKETSKKLASIAARGIKKPDSLTHSEIISLSASVLAQKEKNRTEQVQFCEVCRQPIHAGENWHGFGCKPLDVLEGK